MYSMTAHKATPDPTALRRPGRRSVFCAVSNSIGGTFVFDWGTTTVRLPFDPSIPAANLEIPPVVNAMDEPTFLLLFRSVY